MSNRIVENSPKAKGQHAMINNKRNIVQHKKAIVNGYSEIYGQQTFHYRSKIDLLSIIMLLLEGVTNTYDVEFWCTDEGCVLAQ